MKIGYKDFWAEINLKNFWNKIMRKFGEIIKKCRYRRRKKFRIGMRLLETNFVYQRGIVKTSLAELEEISEKAKKESLFRFFRPRIEECFEQKYIIEVEEEKGYSEEPQDSMCDFYIDI